MSKTLTDALARETEFAAALADTTRGIVVVMDPEGKIVHANRFLAQLLGVEDPKALRGMDWFDTCLPERDRAGVRALYSRAVAGESVHGNRNPVLDRHGVEHQIEWSARRLFGDDGRTIGLLSVGIDISATMEAQRQIERTEARFATVIASTQDAFIFIDRRARISAFNAAAERIFGYTAADVIGKKVNLLMPEPYRAEHDGYIQAYERTGETKAIGRIRVVQGRRSDGEVFPIELSVTQVGLDEDARYAAFIRDVSETVRLREKIVEHQRLVAIGTTSAKFAHEVGNPLNGMLMNLQLMKRRIDKGVSAVDLAPLVQRVEGEVRRLSALLTEFRSMSRRQSFELRPWAAGQILEDFLEDHREEYAACGVQLQLELTGELPRVHVDREKLIQVVLNLAKNAMEAMGDGGGELTLRAREDGVHVILEVEDTAHGVPDEVDVFEPFVTTKGQGTGLGLAVARQIVAAHGGELDYETRPGQGTTFHVRLPIDAPSASSVKLARVRT